MKKILYLMFLLTLTSGCASGPYVRSDIFVDTKTVKSIYVMPITTEITIDSDLQIPQVELQAKLNESKIKIKELLDTELMKRGYLIEGYSKEFNDLDIKERSDRLAREATQEFLHPSNQNDASNQLFKTFLEKAIFTGEFTITDEEGNTKKITKEDIPSKKMMDPLISKTLSAQEIFPPQTDTALYLYVKSYIAKRGFWNSLTEDSSVMIRFKMINVNEEKLIFSYETSQNKSDIIHWKSLRNNLTSIIDQIPIKLE